jgi:hypothetical protein
VDASHYSRHGGASKWGRDQAHEWGRVSKLFPFFPGAFSIFFDGYPFPRKFESILLIHSMHSVYKTIGRRLHYLVPISISPLFIHWILTLVQPHVFKEVIYKN